MRLPTRLPKPAEIAKRRQKLFPAETVNESRDRMAKSIGEGRLSGRSIQNAELGKPQLTTTLALIAQALAVTLDDVSESEEGSAAEVVSPTEPLVHYDFGRRDEAFSAVLQWQQLLRPDRVRILAFTGHTLGLQRFLRHGKVELLLGSQETADTMKMTRQAQLFPAWSAIEAPDLQDAIEEGRLTVRRHPCPPSFTGIALDSEVYLINHHVWLPLSPGPAYANEETIAALKSHYRRYGITHLAASKDPATLAGADLPCTLVVRGGHKAEQEAFRAIEGLFELTWEALNTVSIPAKDLEQYFVS